MSYYRLYFFNTGSEAIVGFEELHAESDAAAIEVAERSSQSQPIELWCGSRRVHRIEIPPLRAAE